MINENGMVATPRNLNETPKTDPQAEMDALMEMIKTMDTSDLDARAELIVRVEKLAKSYLDKGHEDRARTLFNVVAQEVSVRDTNIAHLLTTAEEKLLGAEQVDQINNAS